MQPPVETFERLAAAGIQLLPLAEITSHFVFERGGFVALVERTETGFGNAGSAGLLHARGFAALVWRNGRPFFVGKGFEKPAEPEQVENLRSFSSDLERAIKG